MKCKVFKCRKDARVENDRNSLVNKSKWDDSVSLVGVVFLPTNTLMPCDVMQSISVILVFN